MYTVCVHKCVCVIGVNTNTMLLPGRVPGYKDSDVKLLPSSTTKHTIWELYLQAAAASSKHAVAHSIFTQLWRQLLPNIVIMNPMSDLCWVCQQNSAAITRSANRPEEEKSVVSLYFQKDASMCVEQMHEMGINKNSSCTCNMRTV